MNIRFDNKVVLVTGAAHGFGRAIAIGFAQRGGSVWICDILDAELKETQAMCEAVGGTCNANRVDVRNREEIFAFVTQAIEHDGRVDVVVNNAGGVLGQVGRPLEDISTEDWDSTPLLVVLQPEVFLQEIFQVPVLPRVEFLLVVLFPDLVLLKEGYHPEQVFHLALFPAALQLEVALA